MVFIAYQIVRKLFFNANINNLGKNDKAQLMYIYLPLFCAELTLFIYYRNAIFSLVREFMRINGL